MSFPRYPDYKQSDVEWLGEVPNHWGVASLRHSISAMFNGLTADQVEESYETVPVTRIETISTGSIDLSRLGQIPRSEARLDRRLLAGDILFSNINSLNMIGNCAQYSLQKEIYAGMNLLVLRPSRQVCHRWLYWLIRSTIFRQVVESFAKPAINQASISQSSLNGISITVPTYAEQAAIATFLDRETGKIDALVAEQLRLVELLKEKRQAVISHAVTKGLDPHAPLKPSGIEWLGDVPVHWDILRGSMLGTLFGSEQIPEEAVVEDGDTPFVKVSSLSPTSFKPDGSEWFIDRTYDGKFTSRRGYVVFPKRGAAIFTNKVNIIDFDSAIDPNLMGWLVNDRVTLAFVAYMLKCRRLDELADVSTIPQINNKHIAPERFPVPPPKEQEVIVNYLNHSLAELDKLVTQAECAISLLQERRTALISAAVTGKIDVRGLATAQEPAA